MYTSHTFESERIRVLCPPTEAFHVSDISEDRVDSLHSSGPRRIDKALTRVERFSACGGLHDTQVGGVVFQADGERDDLLAARRDSERVFDSQRGLQDRHKPDRASDPIVGLYLGDAAVQLD